MSTKEEIINRALLGASGGPDAQKTARLEDEIERLRGIIVQIRGFAHVMSDNNWRDLQLHIQRQCGDLEQAGDGGK